jgi:hypothetical protein
MKRVLAVILAAGMFLPLTAVPGGCDTTAGATFLKLFAKPECLAKYGVTIPG